MDILESIQPLIAQAEHVTIDDDRIKAYAANINKAKYHHWLGIAPIASEGWTERQKTEFLFVLDAISFSYWGNPKWQISYEGVTYDGAQAMMTCIGDAINKGSDFSPSRIATIRKKDLADIIKGQGHLPLMDERVHILKEIGSRTTELFGNDFRYVIEKSQGNAQRLVGLLAETFPSFHDSSSYNGKMVYFNKRAQLLAADIDQLVGKLDGVDKLTACADYKNPQVLRRHACLIYSDSLQKKIQAQQEIPKHSREELEIRAHTIYACELLKKEVQGMTANQINDYVWLEGQKKIRGEEPYHRTRTTAY